MQLRPALFLIFLLFKSGLLYSQDQRIADSLIIKLETNEYAKDEYPDLLWELSFNSSNPEDKIVYAKALMNYGKEVGDDRLIFKGKYQFAEGLRRLGDLDSSLFVFLEGLKLARKVGSPASIGESMVAIGDIYSILGNHENSVSYYQDAILVLEEEMDTISLATVWLNLGDEFFNAGNLEKALECFGHSEELFLLLDYEIGIAYNLGNIGLVYAEQGKSVEAENNIQKAVDMLEEMRDFYGISVYLTYMADIYVKKSEIPSALKYGSRSLELANSHGLKEQIRDASLKLSELFELKDNIDSAYYYHKQYVAFRDSINNEETIQKIADLRTEYEVGQKQAEVDVLTTQRNMERVVMLFISILAIVLLILGLIVYKYYKQKSRTSEELSRLNQTKDKFFSIISHDLRGPVSSFMGISRLIKHMVKAKEMDQLLEVADDIDESVLRLSELLDNLLSWAMQQQGHFPNVPEKIHLQEAAHDLVKTLDTMAKSKSINLKTGIDEPIELWADKNTTMTILRNLVNNALKFTPEHGEVTITAKEIKGFAHIRVSDTGVGIPKEKVETLFKLQDKKSTYGTSGEKGLGLGLQLVYEFVEMNHGSISVNSREGEGTTFEIRLPLFATDQPKELVL
ncbi:MAG: tetratricopeptide repeat-containing sensor histidine kinase [Marinoscillum sp.]